MPTFEHDVWLAGLITVIVVLFALTPLIIRGWRWIVPLAYIYGCVHIVNGLGHLGISISRQQWIPGVLSFPLLVVAGMWLLIETGRVPRLVDSPSRTGSLNGSSH